MALYTSYLGFFNRKGVVCDSELIFVMRGRGNPEVEPPEMVLRLWKEKAIMWQGYSDAYLDSLNCMASFVWMQKVAEKAQDHDVVLVCFEKSPEFCHRRLLAERIQDFYKIQYLGELK